MIMITGTYLAVILRDTYVQAMERETANDHNDRGSNILLCISSYKIFCSFQFSSPGIHLLLKNLNVIWNFSYSCRYAMVPEASRGYISGVACN